MCVCEREIEIESVWGGRVGGVRGRHVRETKSGRNSQQSIIMGTGRELSKKSKKKKKVNVLRRAYSACD